jgi:perosamine synthetase
VVALREQLGRERRDAILTELRRRGIGCRNYFAPIHLQPFYRDRFGLKEGMFPITESVAARTIALPFFNQLSASQVERVARALREALAVTRPTRV